MMAASGFRKRDFLSIKRKRLGSFESTWPVRKQLPYSGRPPALAPAPADRVPHASFCPPLWSARSRTHSELASRRHVAGPRLSHNHLTQTASSNPHVSRWDGSRSLPSYRTNIFRLLGSPANACGAIEVSRFQRTSRRSK